MKKIKLIIVVAMIFLLSGCVNNNTEVVLLKSVGLSEPLYIQGLEFHYDESGNRELYAGLGLNNDSRIVTINTLTGDVTEIKHRNTILDTLFNDYFGEGISFGPKGLYQLTWKNERGFIRDPIKGNIIGGFTYNGEGWGLSYDKDNDVFYMTDGTSVIRVMDPNNFEEVESFDIGISNLNEIEYYNGFLFANVWKEKRILKIDLRNKVVAREYDLSKICNAEKMHGDDVLNGIAHYKDNKFIISGKNWKNLYFVEFKDT